MNPIEYLNTAPEALMSQHAKSFSFAASVLSGKQLQDIARLYQLCRVIDDCADELPPPEGLKYLCDFQNALSGDSSEFNLAYRPLQQLGIESKHLRALIQGGLFDVKCETVILDQDLIRYCYLVAGVVGVMMCTLLGAQDSRAKLYARDLGIAMQLTNICRDVKVDAEKGRIYLPGLQFSSHHLASAEFTPLELRTCVQRWLDEADLYYESAYKGLSFLPLRARFCILVAGEVYRAIGHKIRSQSYEVHSGRAYLTKIEKIFVVIKSLPRLFFPNFWRKPVLREQLAFDEFLSNVEAHHV